MKTIFTLLVLLTTVAFAPNTKEKGYDIGDVATDFKLKNIDIVLFYDRSSAYTYHRNNPLVAPSKQYGSVALCGSNCGVLCSFSLRGLLVSHFFPLFCDICVKQPLTLQ